MFAATIHDGPAGGVHMQLLGKRLLVVKYGDLFQSLTASFQPQHFACIKAVTIFFLDQQYRE